MECMPRGTKRMMPTKEPTNNQLYNCISCLFSFILHAVWDRLDFIKKEISKHLIDNKIKQLNFETSSIIISSQN